MRSPLPPLVVLVVLVALVVALSSCFDPSSRTVLERADGCPAALPEAGAPGDECVLAEDCSAFCCECPTIEVEARLCVDGRCADEAATCADARERSTACR